MTATAPAIPKDAICIWKPNEGEQTDFLASPEREVLFGGRAGSGKTDALIMSATRYHKNRAHRAIIFKKIFKEMQEIMEKCESIYPTLGARYWSGRKQWQFPSGATIEFGYLDHKKDIQKYKRAWNWIGFDDLTHWPADDVDRDQNPINSSYAQLISSRLRSVAGSDLPLEVRATTNPDQIGRDWVKRRFNIPDHGGESEFFDVRTKTWRVFIPGKFCPQLSGTSYEQDMEGLPDHLKRMLKDGRWDVIAGAYFKEFDYHIHTCDSFALPFDAEMWRGADDGYNAPACCLWAVKHDKRIYIVDELYKDGMVAEVYGEKVLRIDKQIKVRRDNETSYSERELKGTIDESAFDEDGITKGNGRAQTMNKMGCNWKPAKKPPGSRIIGWSLIHSMLTKKLADGRPELVIFRNCKNLIRTLPTLTINENNPEDIESDGDDHAGDALRYLLTYKPTSVTVGKVTGI